MPITFFEVLNKRIPLKFSQKPKYKYVLKVVAKKRNIEEEDKVYFCGWKRNSSSQKVRDKNFEKTRSAFGDKIAKMSKEKNISSCWTDTENEESLKKLSELSSM